MKRRQELMPVFALMLPIAGCGSAPPAAEGVKTAGPAHSLHAYSLTHLYPGLGRGYAAPVTAARELKDGSLQVLVRGAACTAPTSLRVVETSKAVKVAAREASFVADNQPCSDIIIPWFLSAPIDRPLGNRAVVDLQSRRVVPLMHCAHPLPGPICQGEN